MLGFHAGQDNKRIAAARKSIFLTLTW